MCQALINRIAKGQSRKAVGQQQAIQFLFQTQKRQTLQATWKAHSLQALRKTAFPRSYRLQTTWQCDIGQSLVESIAKGQSLQARWQGDSFQSLVEFSPKD